MRWRKRLGALVLAVALVIMNSNNMGYVLASEIEDFSRKATDSSSVQGNRLEESKNQPGEEESQTDESVTPSGEDETQTGESGARPGEEEPQPEEESTKPGESVTQPEEEPEPGEEAPWPSESENQPGEEDKPGESENQPGEETRPDESGIQPEEEAIRPEENGISTGTDVTIGDTLSVEGTDSFSMFLAEMVGTEIVEQVESNGCNIFSIEVSGSTAIVTFETTQHAALVVGIYDESGTAMLASGRVEVSPDETAAYVDIKTDAMPDYFYLKGFLMDSDCKRPLCTAYASPNYTREMQEFLAKTTDDFEQNRVLNLDEDKTNNFAVYNEDIIIIPWNEGSNVVMSADEVGNTYSFENIDSNISNLQPGDTFAYENADGSVLIVMVASISINGTKASITGIETSMEEVFDFVKIDTTSYTSDVKVDETSCGEGVSYDGEVEMTDENGIQPYVEGEAERSLAKKFSFLDKELNGSGKLSGSVEFQLTAKLKVYISLSQQYIEVKLDYKAKLSLAFSGKSGIPLLPLALLEISPFPGAYIRFTTFLVLEASGKVEVSGELYGTVGSFISAQNGKKSLTTTPKLMAGVKGELTVFIGLSMEPEIVIIHKNVAEANMTAKVGAEVKGTAVYSTDQSVDSSASDFHECVSCVDGDITAEASTSFEVKFLNWKKLTLGLSMSMSRKIMDFYYSFDYDEFGFTSCLHQRYRTTFTILDKNGAALQAAIMQFSDTEITTIAEDGIRQKTKVLITDTNGKAVGFLPSGEYIVKINGAGNVFKRNVVIEEDAVNVVYCLNTADDEGTSIVKNAGQTLGLGEAHSGVIAKDGSLYMWGANNCGQVGNGKTENQNTPTKVLENVVYLSMEGGYNAAITEDKSLYMWGFNADGQVGNGKTENQTTPIKVLDNVVYVTMGYYHSGAITEDGSLYMWGRNDDGQIGNGNRRKQTTPIKVLDNVVYVSLGGHHSGAITGDGKLYMWGWNRFGQIGNGNTNEKQEVPIEVLNNVKYLSLEDNYSGAITEDGSLYMWGENVFGVIGNGSSESIQETPAKVLDGVKLVTLGDGNSGAITEDGSLWMWGNNNYGKAGTEKWESRPKKVLDNTVYVSLGGVHSGAITKDGSLYMWGLNREGEVGSSAEWQYDYYIPLKVLDNVKVPTFQRFPSTFPRVAMLSDLHRIALDISGEPQQVGFTGLLPNETYNFCVMKDRDAEDAFSAANLLYLTQSVTDNAGNLSISYQPTEQADNAAVFVVPMRQTDISAAQVEIGDMSYTGTIQYASPTVRLNRNTLVQGNDYKLTGEYYALDSGTYTVTICGICLYTGTTTASYKILPSLYGDANSDGVVDSKDVVMIKKYLAGYTGLNINLTVSDVNGDGKVDSKDAVKILKKLAGYDVVLGVG